MKKVYKDKKYFICRWDMLIGNLWKGGLIQWSNQYVSGMTVKNSQRVSLDNKREKGR